MAERDKLHTGELYFPNDPEIMHRQAIWQDMVMEYNNIPHAQPQRREEMLRKMFAEVGEGCYVETPFYSNMGGHHVHFGSYVYANYGLTLVDDTHIYVGDYTMLGPHVTLATAGHPIAPQLRQKGLQYNMPVRIGKNCWLGAGVIVLPGVTIGDNTVIGAGSVVTKDIPANVVAVGNPCRVLREVTEKDRLFYDHGRPIDPELLD
jgi:galactoside O-acetyltransferase